MYAPRAGSGNTFRLPLPDVVPFVFRDKGKQLQDKSHRKAALWQFNPLNRTLQQDGRMTVLIPDVSVQS